MQVSHDLSVGQQIAQTASSNMTHDDDEHIERNTSADGIELEVQLRGDLFYLSYRQKRGLRFIHDLWTEWKYGFSGKPAMEFLETHYPKWRAQSGDSKFFTRHRKIIKLIEGIITEGKSEKEAVRIIQMQAGKKSVASFASSI